MNKNDSLSIGFDCADNRNHCILLVGRQNPGASHKALEIISSFSGDEAKAMYAKLTSGGDIKIPNSYNSKNNY